MKISFCSDQNGQIVGRELGSGVAMTLEWSGGVVTRMEQASTSGAGVPWLAPSLLDLQVNGYGGVDYQDPSISVEDLEQSVDRLKRHGCGGSLVTIISDEWGAMLDKLRRLVRFRNANPDLRHFIRGWHLEGPFLSSEEGFRGAHRAEVMRDPDLDLIRDMRSVIGPDLLLVTVAPERKGAIEFIRQCCQQGIQVSLGHSAASAHWVQLAVEAGARGITHFGNGCPQKWERHDNWFWTVVDCQDLYVGLIPDGIHLPKRVFRGMHRALAGRNQVYYTTDAMSAAGAGAGRFPLAGQMFEVGEDQVVRQPGRPNFAGSALSPIDGVMRAQEMLQTSWETVWKRFSEAPAGFMGLDLRLRKGALANFCTVTLADSGSISGVDVYCPSMA